MGFQSGALVPTGPYALYLAPVGTCPHAEETAATREQLQEAMRCLINFARRENGLAPLRTHISLDRSAVLKRADLLRCQEFSHTPCGTAFAEPFRRAGYVRRRYRWSVGENLAWGSGPVGAPRSMMYAWLNSSTHRANVFDSRWRDQGVEVVNAPFLKSPSASVWVSHFGSRARVPRRRRR